MSETKHSDSIFTNEQTRNRRAWIDRALAGVRERSEPGEQARQEPPASRRPRLYVVDSKQSD